MKLSIIIPMYNAEKYIAKCIDSIISNDKCQEHAEIIVINDGSTDNGESIVREYMQDYPYILLKCQENKGLSAARNAGLAIAGGEYVWFVDADDWIRDGSIEGVIREIQESDELGITLDALAIGMTNFNDDGETVNSVFEYNYSHCCSGRDFIDKTNEHLKLCGTLYVYRRDFLISNHLSFVPGIYHEDAQFTPRAIFQAKWIKTSTHKYYQRLLHESSITHTKSSKRVDDILFIIQNLYSYYKQNIEGTPCSSAFCSLLANIANSGCKLADQVGPDVLLSFNNRISAFNWFGSVLRQSSKLKFKLEGLLLLVFPQNYSCIHLILLRLKLRG